MVLTPEQATGFQHRYSMSYKCLSICVFVCVIDQPTAYSGLLMRRPFCARARKEDALRQLLEKVLKGMHYDFLSSTE